MEGFIEAGFENMEPLMGFRDWLADFRNERSKRMIERRDGRVALMGDGVTTVAGPFTVEARQEILARLLDVQGQVGLPLISADEIARIKAFWADDTVEEARRHLKQREQLRAKDRANAQAAVRTAK
jgi:DNA sulfur modification protein DndC